MLQAMARYRDMFWLLIVSDTKTKLENRSDFALSILGMVVHSTTSLFTLVLICNHTNTIAGFDIHDLAFLQGFMLITYAVQNTSFSSQWDIAFKMVDGGIYRYYLRPIHPIVHLALEGFHPHGLAMLLIGFCYCVFGLVDNSIWMNWWYFPVFFFLALCSSLIYLSISIIVTSVAFWLKNPFGCYPIMNLVARVMDVARYPQEIFPNPIRAAFILFPVAFVSYFPSLILTGRSDNFVSVLIGVFSVAAISVCLMVVIWRKGMQAFEGAGG